MLIFGYLFAIKSSAWLCNMLIISMLSIAFISPLSFAEDLPSGESIAPIPSFVLPMGWKLDSGKKLTKRASTLEYSYSGSKTDIFAPIQIFSTYIGVDSLLNQSQGEPSLISSYVEGCIAGRVTESLFSESVSDMIVGGFKCVSDNNNYLVIYLIAQKDKTNHNLVFVWSKEKSKAFAVQDVKVRLGYALQSGVQYLICSKHVAECNPKGNQEYMNNEMNLVYRSISRYNPNIKNNIKNESYEFLDQSYSLYLALFGFVPNFNKNHTERKCFTISKQDEFSTIKICQGYTSKLERRTSNLLVNEENYSTLKKIVIEDKNASLNNICDVGEGSLLVGFDHPEFGIIKEQQWFVCKRNDVTLSMVSVVSVKPESGSGLRIQYHWDVPDSMRQNFELFKNFIAEELVRESLNLYLCNEKSYLHACSTN